MTIDFREFIEIANLELFWVREGVAKKVSSIFSYPGLPSALRKFHPPLRCMLKKHLNC
jgi:hypothetical protein